MCDPVTIAVSAATTAATMSYQHDEQKRQENEVKREQKQAKAEQAAELNKPAPQMVDPVVDPSAKKRQLAALRSGLLSTIKTSPMGVSNIGGKTKLGQ